jgi:hypothetical protein
LSPRIEYGDALLVDLADRVSQQNLDHTDIDVLLKQVRCKAVPQSMRGGNQVKLASQGPAGMPKPLQETRFSDCSREPDNLCTFVSSPRDGAKRLGGVPSQNRKPSFASRHRP